MGESHRYYQNRNIGPTILRQLITLSMVSQIHNNTVMLATQKARINMIAYDKITFIPVPACVSGFHR